MRWNPDTCSTPFGIIGIFTTLRLSIARSTIFSAQRLSASLESSPPEGDDMPARLFAVLNAFRHHWNLHQDGYNFSVISPDVLNAFRHHWNLHVGRAESDCPQTGVLNAFRHHWNLHIYDFDTTDNGAACSTPFGIIGIFTASVCGHAS